MFYTLPDVEGRASNIINLVQKFIGNPYCKLYVFVLKLLLHNATFEDIPVGVPDDTMALMLELKRFDLINYAIENGKYLIRNGKFELTTTELLEYYINCNNLFCDFMIEKVVTLPLISKIMSSMIPEDRKVLLKEQFHVTIRPEYIDLYKLLPQ